MDKASKKPSSAAVRKMGGSAYRGRASTLDSAQSGGAYPRERSGSSGRPDPEADDYGRGYWGNDFDRGDDGSLREAHSSRERDSWRTHSGPGSRSGAAGGYSASGTARGTPGAGWMSDDASDPRDWDMPTGPRTWGSGVGTGVQGRGMAQGRHADPDYQQWRNEQLQRFDDDYEAFRRERYGKFAEEFNAWRSQRTTSKPSPEPATPTSASTATGPASSSSGSGAPTTSTHDTPGSKPHG